MAYITGASADIHTLLTAIKNFAVASGWTANATDTFTLTFTSPLTGSASHADTRSMVSSVITSSAYATQGETSLVANRVVLTKKRRFLAAVRGQQEARQERRQRHLRLPGGLGV